jgi:hypothetical protein
MGQRISFQPCFLGVPLDRDTLVGDLLARQETLGPRAG